MSDTIYDEDDLLKLELFLLNVADGVPIENAGFEVGWTPHQIGKKLADPEIREMIDAAKNRAVGSVEHAMFKLAIQGKNFGAQQFILMNLRSDKWKDMRKIEIKNEHTINGQIVVSTKQAIMEALRENGPAALQPAHHELGSALDSDIVDAEIIE